MTLTISIGIPAYEFMDFSWLPNRDKRLGNPARSFFNKPIIQGDNIEMPNIRTQSDNPISEYLQFLLEKKESIDNLGELLAPLNVKYIILVDEADFKEYDFLYRQTDLSVVKEYPGITLFQNKNPTARVYGVNSVVSVGSLDEYLERSKSENVMDSVYVLNGSSETTGQPSPDRNIAYTMESPVKYHIAGTQYKYTVFTVTQNISTNNWEYNGTKPVKNLGFMPVFTSDTQGGDVVYTRFYRVCLSGYIVSALTLVVILAYWIMKRPLKSE